MYEMKKKKFDFTFILYNHRAALKAQRDFRIYVV